jgi:hypothetical protein
MDDQENLLKKSRFALEKAQDHYRAVPNSHTWQKFHQALKHYVLAFEEQETQKNLKYHERLQRLS